jgi:hypothetical protein
VPSWNFTPLRSQNVQVLPPVSFHFVASAGMIFVVPGLSFTRPSNICSVTRNDSPSETSAGSRYAGSPVPAKINVPAFEAPPAVLAPINTKSAATGRASLLMFPLTRSPFVSRPSEAGRKV